jgi:hypothetical protein
VGFPNPGVEPYGKDPKESESFTPPLLEEGGVKEGLREGQRIAKLVIAREAL